MKRIITIALALLVLCAVGYGGKRIYDQLASVNSSAQEEESTLRWAEATTDPLNLEGISDSSVRYAEAHVSTRLNVVFNKIWNRQTGYFTVPNGTLTITACGTAEGVQRFKVSVWKKVDGGAQYVDGSTGYIKTDGQNYRYVVSGLDPAASYRLTISYDSSKYYLYGMVQAEGLSE